MTITQTTAAPDDDAILDFVDEGVRALQQEGVEPRYVVVGPEAYEALRHAMARRFGRQPGTFESYQWLAIVLDPFRGAGVCVLPSPRELAAGVRAETV